MVTDIVDYGVICTCNELEWQTLPRAAADRHLVLQCFPVSSAAQTDLVRGSGHPDKTVGDWGYISKNWRLSSNAKKRKSKMVKYEIRENTH
jgi:hypothetical protein